MSNLNHSAFDICHSTEAIARPARGGYPCFMSESIKSLWPVDAKRPVFWLVLSLFLAPFIWGSLGSFAGFAIIEMSKGAAQDTLDDTIDVILVSYGLMFGFTFTLGLLGVLVLWWAGQRGAVVWAMTGGLLGGFMAAAFSFASAGMLNQKLMILFVFIGWGLFLTIRWIGGVKPDAD